MSRPNFLTKSRTKALLAINKGRCNMVLPPIARLILGFSNRSANSQVRSNNSRLIFHHSSNRHSPKLLQALAHLECLLNSQTISHLVRRRNSISQLQASHLLSRTVSLNRSILRHRHRFSKTNFSRRVTIHHLRMVPLLALQICRLRQVCLNVPLLVRHL